MGEKRSQSPPSPLSPYFLSPFLPWGVASAFLQPRGPGGSPDRAIEKLLPDTCLPPLCSPRVEAGRGSRAVWGAVPDTGSLYLPR